MQQKHEIDENWIHFLLSDISDLSTEYSYIHIMLPTYQNKHSSLI